LRRAFIGAWHFGAGLDVAILVVVAGAFLALGAYTFSKVQV
jgi:hypothetical protein